MENNSVALGIFPPEEKKTENGLSELLDKLAEMASKRAEKMDAEQEEIEARRIEKRTIQGSIEETAGRLVAEIDKKLDSPDPLLCCEIGDMSRALVEITQALAQAETYACIGYVGFGGCV